MLLRFENVAQTVVYFLAIIGVIGLVHSLMKERSLGADSSQVFYESSAVRLFHWRIPLLSFLGSKKYLHATFLLIVVPSSSLWHSEYC